MKFKLTCGVLRMAGSVGVDFGLFISFRSCCWLAHTHIAIYLKITFGVEYGLVEIHSVSFGPQEFNSQKSTAHACVSQTNNTKRILMDKKLLNEHAATSAVPSTEKEICGSNRICRVMHT